MSLPGIMIADDCVAFEEGTLDKALAEASPPASTKPKRSQAGRSTTRGGKGTKLCEACQEWKLEGEFSLNQSVDMLCKKYPSVDISSVKGTEPIRPDRQSLFNTMSEIT